jgi:H+/Cl- antiporter ClcA
MKQVYKQYDQAFLLEPTKLGRIVDTIHQRLADHADTTTHDAFEVFLTGNRSEELTSLEEVLALDNSRRQRITRLLISCTAATSSAPRPEHEVQVDFAVPKPSGSSPGSTTRVVAIGVRSDASGWASRTLSEVEEQIERTWLSRGRPLVILCLLFFAGLILLISQFVSLRAGARPEYMWLTDHDIERVQVLLLPNHTLTDEEMREVVTMQLRNVAGPQGPARQQSDQVQRPFLLALPLVVILGCIVMLFVTSYPSAVFLWGDEIQRYNNALQRRKVLWGVVIGITVIGLSSKFLFEWISVWFQRHP